MKNMIKQVYTFDAANLIVQNERAYKNKTGCNWHSCSDCYQYSHQHSTCWWLRSPLLVVATIVTA